MLSLVVCGLPICLPLALAFAIPDRTRSRIMASSNWLNTPAICKKASLIGSALPSRQSSVILPIITRRRRFSRTRSMISHSCWVLRASRGTSKVRMVSPTCACANIASCWLLILLSPCSYSRKRVSAPADFSSRTWRLISCLVSLVDFHPLKYAPAGRTANRGLPH